MMPMMMPMRQFGTMFLENVEQMTDFQIELMRSCTHYTMRQWRDALEIRDAHSLQQFLERQSQATEQLTREITQGAEKAVQATQEVAQRGLGALRKSGEMGLSAMREGAEQAAQMGERAMAAGEHARPSPAATGEHARPTAARRAGPPLDNYDELSIEDIEQRLDKLNRDQLRQLSEYEGKNKNRKTLMESLQRRI